VQINAAPLWLAATNCWVVSTEPGGPAVIVDAPPDLEATVQLVEEAGVIPVALLNTHGHVDHVGGARAVVERYRVTAYLHPDDDWLARDPHTQLMWFFGLAPPGDFAPPERFEDLADGQVLELVGLEFRVLHTPGHTPGHCCFHTEAEGALFSGDLLFAGSIGRTDLPGGDDAAMMRSLRTVAGLPGETEVFSGHGPATTIARELQANPFLQSIRT
jgi:glyoxylase-like metal-dependent hydrolase (beta-lactamase superfamily II)